LQAERGCLANASGLDGGETRRSPDSWGAPPIAPTSSFRITGLSNIDGERPYARGRAFCTLPARCGRSPVGTKNHPYVLRPPAVLHRRGACRSRAQGRGTAVPRLMDRRRGPTGLRHRRAAAQRGPTLIGAQATDCGRLLRRGRISHPALFVMLLQRSKLRHDRGRAKNLPLRLGETEDSRPRMLPENNEKMKVQEGPRRAPPKSKMNSGPRVRDRPRHQRRATHRTRRQGKPRPAKRGPRG